MSRSSKAVIIAATMVGLCLFWVCTGGIRDIIADRIKQSKTAEKAYSAAVEYYTEKYGISPVIIETEPIRIGKAGVTFETVFSGYVVLHEESCKIIYYNGKCYDTKQYDDICRSAVEIYFEDTDIGEIAEYDIELNFFPHTMISRSYSDEKGYYADREKFMDKYFSGDIESFLNEIPHSMKACITYIGAAEKCGEYKILLENKLNELNGVCYEARLYVKDSRNESDSDISGKPYVDEYIAMGNLSDGEITVYP